MNARTPRPVTVLAALAAAATVCFAAPLTASTISLYQPDGMFFTGTPGGFSFDAFAGNVTETASSLTIDAAAFGGLGRDIGPVDFDADDYQVRIEYRLLAGNVADDFRIILRDNDGDDTAAGQGSEDHQIFIDTSFATPLGDGSGFSEQFAPLNPVFTAKSFGFTNDGDGVLNPGLTQWQLQSAFGSTDRLYLEVRSIELVPEPASAALGGLGLLLLSLRRRG